MAEIRRMDGIWNTVLEKKDRLKLRRNIPEILKKVPIFEGLTHREIHNIARIAYQRYYHEGEVVIHEGDAAAGMYTIVAGTVKVTKELSDGTVIYLTTLEDGDFFGDVGLLDNSPRTATVTAIQDLKIVGFFRPELLHLMDSDPKLASKLTFKLAQILAARLRFTNNEMEKAQEEIDRLKVLLDDAPDTSKGNPPV